MIKFNVGELIVRSHRVIAVGNHFYTLVEDGDGEDRKSIQPIDNIDRYYELTTPAQPTDPEFPFKVGDKIIGGAFNSSAVVITAIGEKFFLALNADGLENIYGKAARCYGQRTDVTWRTDVAWRLCGAPQPEPDLTSLLVNIYPSGALGTFGSADSRDARAGRVRIGRKNIGTGEWVPCDGKEVLA